VNIEKERSFESLKESKQRKNSKSVHFFCKLHPFQIIFIKTASFVTLGGNILKLEINTFDKAYSNDMKYEVSLEKQDNSPI